MRSLLTFFHVYSVFRQYSFRPGQQTCALSSFYKNFIVHPLRNQCRMQVKDLSDWQFGPSTLQQLPVDNVKENYVRKNVRNAVFSEVRPSPLLTDIKLVDYSEDVLVNILDLDPSVTESRDFIEFVAGNKILKSSVPVAHRYGGYQFGSWAMQLGDGRAILLGEYVNEIGESWELQLKGAGKTPYSRDGDGRAVLRSSIREFLASEAMYYLGIPTSRAAAIVVSDDEVIRDPLYNGYVRKERAAVVLRVAKTWFRFGSLEILTRTGELQLLRKLTDFIIQEYFPEIERGNADTYVRFFTAVASNTLDTVVAWQAVGFAHGVLNTDNMSILGITIDYGPFGFCEAYDPHISPNHSDREGRYSFNNQIEVVRWNLEKLAAALSPLLNEPQRQTITEICQSLDGHSARKVRQEFAQCFSTVFRSKLGLELDDEIDELLRLLFTMMEESGGDFTMTFRQLGEININDMLKEEVLEQPKFWSLYRLYQNEKYPEFVEIYQKRVLTEGISEEDRKLRINTINPRYILRNWMAQSAIQKAENNDFTEVRFIQKILKHPFTVNAEAEKAGYAGPTPDWALNLKVSCSS